jgi:hypothetical protein
MTLVKKVPIIPVIPSIGYEDYKSFGYPEGYILAVSRTNILAFSYNKTSLAYNLIYDVWLERSTVDFGDMRHHCSYKSLIFFTSSKKADIQVFDFIKQRFGYVIIGDRDKAFIRKIMKRDLRFFVKSHSITFDVWKRHGFLWINTLTGYALCLAYSIIYKDLLIFLTNGSRLHCNIVQPLFGYLLCFSRILPVSLYKKTGNSVNLIAKLVRYRYEIKDAMRYHASSPIRLLFLSYEKLGFVGFDFTPATCLPTRRLYNGNLNNFLTSFLPKIKNLRRSDDFGSDRFGNVYQLERGFAKRSQVSLKYVNIYSWN